MFYCFWGLVIVAHTPPFIYFRLIVFFFLKTFHGLLTAPRNKTTKFTPPAQMQNYEEIPNYSSPHTHTHLPLQSCLTPAQIVSHTYREVPFCCWKMVWFFSSALPDLQERSHCYSQEFPKASYAYYGWILSRLKKKDLNLISFWVEIKFFGVIYWRCLIRAVSLVYNKEPANFCASYYWNSLVYSRLFIQL